MPEYTLKISDGYCTWVFELNGSNRLSIQMLLDNAIKDTGLYVAKEYIEGAKTPNNKFKLIRLKSLTTASGYTDN